MTKKIILFFFAGAVFLNSCKKEDQEHKSVRVKTYHPIDEGYMFNPDFSFFYDEEGKVTRINNTNYYYRPDGKVDYTRTGDTEVFSREQFYWDEQGRLSRIVVDSIYSLKDGVGQLRRNIPKTTFTYTGNAKLPSSISYFLQLDETINMDSRHDYTYEGENVHTVTITNSGNIVKKIFYKMSGHESALYGIYKQMGFNPVYPFEIISKNNAAFSYTKFVNSSSNIVIPEWNKAAKHESTYNQYGLPVLIKIHNSNMEADIDDVMVKITYYE
ncbi:MAG TPA: hypothetical protein PKA53_03610 [Sphingobacterium sp.]|nr:hypothetical protein [Sphingobacterium sp.]